MRKKLRSIEVEPYGKEGCKPKEKHLCVYNGEESCKSSSGGSLCGGNKVIMKVRNKTSVLCGYELPKL